MAHSDATVVIFRKWNNGQVIALFPMEPVTYNPAYCESFEHIGQHGAADPHGIVLRTTAASPDEYAAVKRELESAPYGYQLEVRKRIPANAYESRKRKILGAA